MPNRYVSAKTALSLVTTGNQRWMEGKSRYPDQTIAHRLECANGQRPFATVVGCSDSRVPIELLLDHGLGQLFVIRTAGHVVGRSTLGSVEYGVSELKTPLLMVVGHQRCGAIKAAMNSVLKGAQHGGHISRIVRQIKPAVRLAKKKIDCSTLGDLHEAAVLIHIERTIERIMQSPIVVNRLEKGRLWIVGAYYHLQTGQVKICVPQSQIKKKLALLS